jgi:PBP1b-binding outer membrane lipoprotein LpoB
MKTKIFSILLILFTISGCATMMGDRTVNVTGDQIAQKLNEKMALPISLLKVFDVNLSNSLVTFDKATGRMTTTMDTKLSSQMLDKTLLGKLGISGKLRFDAATSTVVLDEPKIENINFDGANGKFNEVFSAMAKTVGGEMLNGLTLYTVKPEDLKFGGTTYAPKDMVVTDNGLQLTLSPAK